MIDVSQWWVAGDSQNGVLIDGRVGMVTPGQALAAIKQRDAEIERLEQRYRRQVFDCEGSCELDRDGHGGKASPCHRCPRHPLRQGDDPAEAIRRYLR